jgi:translation elongation factor EF-G
MGIETIVEKLCEEKEENLKEIEEDIKKEIKYEDTEKVLPGDIKVIERKIIKYPIPYNEKLWKLQKFNY